MLSKVRSGSIAAFASILIAVPLDQPQQQQQQPLLPATRPQPVETVVVTPPAPAYREFSASVRALDLEAVAVPEIAGSPLQPLAYAVEPSARQAVAAAPDVAPAPARAKEPVVQATVVDRSVPGISVHSPFESVAEEFPGALAVAVPQLAVDAKWRRVLQDAPVHPNTPSWQRWDELVQQVSHLSGEERLQAVNEGINHLIGYATDQAIYGVADYWATLEESVSRGSGDCEDIAIAKMWLLHAAGVDLSTMRLVVLKDTLRNLDHAVLTVVEDGHQYVLDNLSWKVGHADWMRGYRPIYALSATGSWIYGMRALQQPLQVAQNAPPVQVQ